MSKNKTLSAAKSAKNDEFYTQYADIQKEINAYKWSCQDSQATVSSNPFIANGPDRWKTK